VWDWGNEAQAESYFDTADPTQNAVSGTWLDWCCDASGVSAPGAWINYLTAQAGGIVPLQPASGNAQTAGAAPITLQVHAGANGTAVDGASTRRQGARGLPLLQRHPGQCRGHADPRLVLRPT
jgi:hypothetical protein